MVLDGTDHDRSNDGDDDGDDLTVMVVFVPLMQMLRS